MPTSGPDYFSTSSSISSHWLTPENIENAPDGLTARWNAGTNADWIFLFDWQGSVPAGYYWDFPNFVLELYMSSISQTINFRTQIITRADGLPFSGISSDKSVSIIGTNTWLNITNPDWSIPSKLPTHIAIGIAFAADASAISQISVDSARLTVSYNSDDGFFQPGYGFVKNRRRFVSRRNKQVKVVSRQTKQRMQKAA